MWVKEKPKAEGWYMWRKMTTQNDPWKWHAYFIDSGGDVWENGTAVLDPHGGWWSSVPCGIPAT